MYIKMQKAELCFYQSSHQSSYYQEEITINILISVYLQIYMSSVFTMIVLYTLHNSMHTTLYCLCFNFNVLLQLFFHITKIIFSFCLSLYHCVCVCMLICFSCVRLFVILWTVAHQAPLSMGFSRQEYESGLPLPPPGIFLTQGLNPHLLHLLHGEVRLHLLSHLGSPLYHYQVLR